MMPATDRMPSPTNTATMIRMIFSALLPPVEAGAAVAATGLYPDAAGAYGVAAGAFEAAGAETAAPTGAPHFVQKLVSPEISAPHFVQKLAMVLSLSLGVNVTAP